MAVTCEDLLSCAQTLSQTAEEATLRASVSRAYYSAYHRADRWHEGLPAQGSAAGGQGMHATLIECLVSPSVTGPVAQRSRSIGYMLRHMKASRTKADYRLDEVVDGGEAATAVAAAAQVLSKAV